MQQNGEWQNETKSKCPNVQMSKCPMPKCFKCPNDYTIQNTVSSLTTNTTIKTMNTIQDPTNSKQQTKMRKSKKQKVKNSVLLFCCFAVVLILNSEIANAFTLLRFFVFSFFVFFAFVCPFFRFCFFKVSERVSECVRERESERTSTL